MGTKTGESIPKCVGTCADAIPAHVSAMADFCEHVCKDVIDRKRAFDEALENWAVDEGVCPRSARFAFYFNTGRRPTSLTRQWSAADEVKFRRVMFARDEANVAMWTRAGRALGVFEAIVDASMVKGRPVRVGRGASQGESAIGGNWTPVDPEFVADVTCQTLFLHWQNLAQTTLRSARSARSTSSRAQPIKSSHSQKKRKIRGEGPPISRLTTAAFDADLALLLRCPAASGVDDVVYWQAAFDLLNNQVKRAIPASVDVYINIARELHGTTALVWTGIDGVNYEAPNEWRFLSLHDTSSARPTPLVGVGAHNVVRTHVQEGVCTMDVVDDAKPRRLSPYAATRSSRTGALTLSMAILKRYHGNEFERVILWLEYFVNLARATSGRHHECRWGSTGLYKGSHEREFAPCEDEVLVRANRRPIRLRPAPAGSHYALIREYWSPDALAWVEMLPDVEPPSDEVVAGRHLAVQLLERADKFTD